MIARNNLQLYENLGQLKIYKPLIKIAVYIGNLYIFSLYFRYIELSWSPGIMKREGGKEYLEERRTEKLRELQEFFIIVINQENTVIHFFSLVFNPNI